MNDKWKSIADFLPALGFFGLFFLFGRDMMTATAGLVVGLIAQIAIYKFRSIPIQTWMWIVLGIGVFFGALTLLFQNPTFIKLRPSIVGGLLGVLIVGSVLIKKNIFKGLLGRFLNYPTKTWNVVAILWSLPIFGNALLNLVIANQVPWWNLGFTDDFWVTYRLVGGFFVVGLSFGLVATYLFLTKQKLRTAVNQAALDRETQR